MAEGLKAFEASDLKPSTDNCTFKFHRRSFIFLSAFYLALDDVVGGGGQEVVQRRLDSPDEDETLNLHSRF